MEKKANVSKHILDRAAFIFIHHPDEPYTRLDIQKALGISKSTACRLMTELSRLLSLYEEKEGQTVYYKLPRESAQSIYNSLELIIALTDKERLALNFLLNGKGVSSIFNDSIINLSHKLDNAGIISYMPNSVKETTGTPQIVKEGSENYIDTILTALETKTIIEIDYKGAFSDRIKTHELYPVGMYIRDGNLYLYAYNPKYDNATSYAYSRIRSISLKYDEHYTIPEDISMDCVINDPFGIAMTKPKRAKVHVYNKQAFFEKEKKWPEGTVLTECEDGSIILELTISDPFAFRTWALSLGKDCFVESPEEFALWIRDEHKAALALYEKEEQK